ncbi:MAG: L-2-amino-thiazoline-4-carboxylic acid hydrolase [Ruminococcus sp.]|nr:L-2-amino-thiazoline-4-carboxylic acid hydrolase [Ruminococcus sp.]
MKYTFKTWFIGNFFYSATKSLLKEKGVSQTSLRKIKAECKEITVRAKEMSQSNLTSSYIMGIYFIAMNRHSGLSAQDNYEIIETAMKASKVFKKGLGSAEDYLDEKKMPRRVKWAEESHKIRNENNWVVDVLPKCEEYDLGYDYHECGICKICRDEGCFELAKYLCRLDFIMADMMGADLVRTKTIAEGGDMCDFRYSLKK